VLSKTNTVYALDMIGYGRSDKPADFVYTMEAWGEVKLSPLSLFLVHESDFSTSQRMKRFAMATSYQPLRISVSSRHYAYRSCSLR
jgi:pimeloyl-ACP methyl ester carboxylesterase